MLCAAIYCTHICEIHNLVVLATKVEGIYQGQYTIVQSTGCATTTVLEIGHLAIPAVTIHIGKGDIWK